MPNVGLSLGLENLWLNTLRNVPFTAPATCLQLHTGQPGPNGTSNPSAVTSRQAATFTVASGTLSLTGTPPVWEMTSSEVISYISVWSGFDGDGAAIFLWSMALRVPKQVANGDLFSQTTADLVFTVAAT